MSDQAIKLNEEGPPIGSLFANTIRDIRRSIPLGTTAAIDLKMSFKSVQVSKKGFDLIFVNQKDNTSSLQIDLTTRIHTDDLARPTMAEIILFVQDQLRINGHFKGELDGLHSAALDLALTNALQAIQQSASTSAKLKATITNLTDPNRKLFGYLQIRLKMPEESVDGYFGPNTEHAFIMRRIDYSVITTTTP